MKKFLRYLGILAAATLVAIIPAQAASAAPGQDPDDAAEWIHPGDLCIENRMGQRWDDHIEDAAYVWGWFSAIDIEVRNRADCDWDHTKSTIVIKRADLPSGSAGQTYNYVDGSWPDWTKKRAVIKLDPSKIDPWVTNDKRPRQLACHEIGHALGISHYWTDDSCMTKSVRHGAAWYPSKTDWNFLSELYPE